MQGEWDLLAVADDGNPRRTRLFVAEDGREKRIRCDGPMPFPADYLKSEESWIVGVFVLIAGQSELEDDAIDLIGKLPDCERCVIPGVDIVQVASQDS